MANSQYDYIQHMIANLPDGITYANGQFIVADSKRFSVRKITDLYYNQLIRNGYNFTPPEPEPEEELG